MKFVNILKHIRALDWFLASGALTLIAISLSPLKELLNQTTSQKVIPFRHVLSVANGSAPDDATSLQAIKVETSAGILLEIYDTTNHLKPVLLDSHEIPGHKNAYIHVQGEPTALAFTNSKAGDALELAVPTYDRNLTPRLNVFQFDKVGKKFQPISPSP